MAEEEKINTDIDDWLNDLEDEDSGVEELDQADIDSLLGSDAEAAAEEEAGGEELNGELDQADIDSLLGESAAEEEAAPAEEEGTIDQEEMDKLFGSAEEQEASPGDEVDFAEILGDQEDASSFSDFDADTFSLEPEEDEDKTVEQKPQPATAQASADDQPPVHTSEKAADVAQAAMAEKAIRKKPMPNRFLQVLLGMLIILLLGGGGAYYYFATKPAEKAVVVTEEEKPAPPTQQQVQRAAPPPEKEASAPKNLASMPSVQSVQSVPAKPNHKPVASGNLYQMPAKGGEVAIQLQAEDADGDPLTYELLDPPSHGRLSGTPPSLVYLPNADFPGRDSFTFRASDGKDKGEKAVMYIAGPNLAAAEKRQDTGKQVVQQKKKEQLGVFANDAQLTTTSSEILIIDWLALWKQDDNGAVDSSCGVEVKSGPLQGTLSKVDAWHYRYQPPKFFQGREIISFRFNRGKKYSVDRLLTVKVKLGDSKPEIVVAPLASEYSTGQTVTINAQGSKDEKRAELRFFWQQLTGVPIKLEAENKEGSVVSFIMPSTFNVDSNNELTIQVTAIDAGGKKTIRDIQFRSISRRHQALWAEVACD